MGGGRGGKKCFKATDGVWKLPLKSKDIHHIITLLGSLMSFIFSSVEGSLMIWMWECRTCSDVCAGPMRVWWLLSSFITLFSNIGLQLRLLSGDRD